MKSEYSYEKNSLKYFCFSKEFPEPASVAIIICQKVDMKNCKEVGTQIFEMEISGSILLGRSDRIQQHKVSPSKLLV